MRSMPAQITLALAGLVTCKQLMSQVFILIKNLFFKRSISCGLLDTSPTKAKYFLVKCESSYPKCVFLLFYHKMFRR